ncbi:carbohydrate binding domain protein [Ruminiclostridium hungatei]|uniref:Carbohydrate binding domain protein n=1 Tax=Ruminiclostridium hungatei TaxID=48256 RepID=A0A1V4SGP5_RUMHU|nr:carbohydrate-binding protein [Ruminiclostridium hungatei]OPX43040.1 carbohydrate binding domain protein [Ruminiclostridium hungatei]
MTVKTYEDNGVILSRKAFYSGDRLKITYRGLLASEGAESVYLHFGFGDGWDSSSYIQMERISEGFLAEIQVQDGKSLELCFKDSANNWDNNSGNNYVYKISAKRQKKAAAGAGDGERPGKARGTAVKTGETKRKAKKVTG